MKKLAGTSIYWTISGMALSLALNAQGFADQAAKAVQAPQAQKQAPIAPPKQGSKLRLEISGKSSFHILSGSQSNRKVYKYDAGAVSESKPKGDSTMFSMDSSKLNFKASGKSEGGLEYSLLFSLTGDTNATNSVREAYLRLTDTWGTLMLGDTSGPEDFMGLGGFSVQAGSGGFDGKFDRVLNVTTGVKPDISLTGDSGDATKVVYVTPRLEGFQAAVAFTPDTKHEGSAKLKTDGHPDSDNPSPYDRNHVAFGVSYLKKTDDFQFSLALTGMVGSTQPEKKPAANRSLDRHDTRTWAIGSTVEYGKFAFGAEYVWGGKSQQLKAAVANVDPNGGPINGLTPLNYDPGKARAGDVINVGASYKLACDTKVSVGYFHSFRKTGFGDHKATADIFSLGVERKVVEGLTVYGEVAHHNLKNPSAFYEAKMLSASRGGSVKAVPNNRANTVILGTKIQF